MQGSAPAGCGTVLECEGCPCEADPRPRARCAAPGRGARPARAWHHAGPEGWALIGPPLLVALFELEPEATPGPHVQAVAGAGPVFPDPGGFGGDGRPALKALISHPSQVAPMPDGGIVFTDSANERIRTISPAGIITTLAGDGRKCATPTDPCGDGGPATTAQLNVPHDVAVQADGSVLIADTFDNRIRRVTSDGTIATVAGTGQSCPSGSDPCGRGGPAAEARLALPAGLHPLPGGGFVFVDHATARVRAVHQGTLLDLAGAGAPGLAGDGGPALDARFNAIADAEPLPGGGFLVADGRNCRLRRVTADGTVVPYAGAEPLERCGALDARPARRSRRRRDGRSRVVGGSRLPRGRRRRERLLPRYLRQPDPPHRSRRPHLDRGRDRRDGGVRRRRWAGAGGAAGLAERRRAETFRRTAVHGLGQQPDPPARRPRPSRGGAARGLVARRPAAGSALGSAKHGHGRHRPVGARLPAGARAGSRLCRLGGGASRWRGLRPRARSSLRPAAATRWPSRSPQARSHR